MDNGKYLRKMDPKSGNLNDGLNDSIDRIKRLEFHIQREGRGGRDMKIFDEENIGTVVLLDREGKISWYGRDDKLSSALQKASVAYHLHKSRAEGNLNLRNELFGDNALSYIENIVEEPVFAGAVATRLDGVSYFIGVSHALLHPKYKADLLSLSGKQGISVSQKSHDLLAGAAEQVMAELTARFLPHQNSKWYVLEEPQYFREIARLS